MIDISSSYLPTALDGPPLPHHISQIMILHMAMTHLMTQMQYVCSKMAEYWMDRPRFAGLDRGNHEEMKVRMKGWHILEELCVVEILSLTGHLCFGALLQVCWLAVVTYGLGGKI